MYLKYTTNIFYKNKLVTGNDLGACFNLSTMLTLSPMMINCIEIYFKYLNNLY